MATTIERQTAYFTTISTLLNGNFIKAEAHMQPSFLRTASGKEMSRVHIIAVIVGFGDGSEATLDDGSGKITCRSFDNPALFSAFNLGDIVRVIGKVRAYNEQQYLIPEIVKKITNKQFVTFHKLALQSLEAQEEHVRPGYSVPTAELASEEIISAEAVDEIPIDEKLFMETAQRINAILHTGGIIRDYRARVMACFLLGLSKDAKINLNESPAILINSINARVNAVLQREGKPNFYQYLDIALPSSTENHVKFKQALVLTIQELLNLNIRSAMNSGTDVLGKFYEAFLKYGNGAKEIGVVLTPRHITKFSAETLDIKKNDLVLDVACGTGGFLVSAFDYVKKNSTEEELNIFKKNNAVRLMISGRRKFLVILKDFQLVGFFNRNGQSFFQ